MWKAARGMDGDTSRRSRVPGGEGSEGERSRVSAGSPARQAGVLEVSLVLA